MEGGDSEEKKKQQQQQQQRKRYDIPKTASCHVCGDQAAEHLHYGGIACYSCRAFFRRTVNSTRPILDCSNGNGCKINKETRKRCQYCRFEKCKSVGMKPSWVLSEEDKTKLAAGGRKVPGPDTSFIKKEEPMSEPRFQNDLQNFQGSSLQYNPFFEQQRNLHSFIEKNRSSVEPGMYGMVGGSGKLPETATGGPIGASQMKAEYMNGGPSGASPMKAEYMNGRPSGASPMKAEYMSGGPSCAGPLDAEQNRAPAPNTIRSPADTGEKDFSQPASFSLKNQENSYPFPYNKNQEQQSAFPFNKMQVSLSAPGMRDDVSFTIETHKKRVLGHQEQENEQLTPQTTQQVRGGRQDFREGPFFNPPGPQHAPAGHPSGLSGPHQGPAGPPQNRLESDGVYQGYSAGPGVVVGPSRRWSYNTQNMDNSYFDVNKRIKTEVAHSPPTRTVICAGGGRGRGGRGGGVGGGGVLGGGVIGGGGNVVGRCGEVGRQGGGGDVVARCGEVGREGGQQGGGGDVVARCGEVGRQGGQHGGEGGEQANLNSGTQFQQSLQYWNSSPEYDMEEKPSANIWKLDESPFSDPNNIFPETLFLEQLAAIDERVRFQVPMEQEHGRAFLDCALSQRKISQTTIMHAYQICIKRIVRFSNSLQDFVELPPEDMHKLLVANTVNMIIIRIARWFHPQNSLENQLALCCTGVDFYKEVTIQQDLDPEYVECPVTLSDVFSSPWCCDSFYEDRFITLIDTMHELPFDESCQILLSVMVLFDSEKTSGLENAQMILSHEKKFSLLLYRYLKSKYSVKEADDYLQKFIDAVSNLRELADILVNKRILC